MHQNLETTQTPLYKLFFEFYISKNDDKAGAEIFAKQMESVFESQAHRFVTISTNLKDGIGDYTSHVYFIEKLTALLSQYKNIDLKNIAYVSEKKQPLAKIVSENKVHEDSMFMLGKGDFNEDYFKQKTTFLGVPDKKETDILNRFINESDLVLNLAIGLTLTDDKDQLKIKEHGLYGYLNPKHNCIVPVKENALIESWVQYEFHSKEAPKLNDRYANDRSINISYKGPIFSERAMGLHENQMGIRFDKPILDNLNKDQNDLFLSLSDDFKQRVFKDSIEVKNQSFAIGYMQSKSASRGLVLMAVKTTANVGDMNILVNLSYFQSYKDQNIKETFYNHLKEMGITSIEFIAKEGITETVKLSEQTENERTLRLIDFKGISESNKTTLYCLSEVIGASGDNSISDMISVGLKSNHTPLPFPQQYVTSDGSCIQSILEEVKKFQEKENTSHQELVDYLQNLFNSTSHPSHSLVQFKFDHDYADTIKNNQKKITTSWKKFCEFCYINKNNDTHLAELLSRYILHYLLINNGLENFQTIVELLPKNALQNETLLHLAIRANNEEAVEYLLKNKVCDNAINKQQSFNRSTPLHMAALLGNLKMVQLLVQYGADTTIIDSNSHTAFDIAIKKNHINMCRVLLDKNADRQEFLNEALYYAGINDNQVLMESLIAAGANCNWLAKEWPHYCILENAITEKRITQVQFLLEHGADANYENFVYKALRYPKILALLLEHKSNLNVKYFDKTPLEYACSNDVYPEESLKLLLDYGADIHEVNADNDTALHHAAREGNLKVIQCLIKHGADTTLKNSNQHTPWDAYLARCEKEQSCYNFFGFAKNKEAIRALLQDIKPTPENKPESDSGCTIL